MYKAAKMASKTKSKREELTLALDWDNLDACNGFTFDMGGSVMKVVYISKDDWVEPSKRKRGSKGLVRLVNFSREELDEAIQFINTNARLRKNPTTGLVDIYSTGYGGAEFADRFKKEIHTNNTSLSEMDCFIRAFMHMSKTLSRKDLLFPSSKEAYKAINEEMVKVIGIGKMMSQSGETSVYRDLGDKLDKPIKFPDPESTSPDKPITENKDLFPCILMMLGSGFAAFVVYEDGSFHMADMSLRGGRMFLGLGSLLTGGKNYPELMKLCEKGDLGNVTVTTKTLAAQARQNIDPNAEKKSDMYSVTLKEGLYDSPVLYFGHAVGKVASDFKSEDLIRALLHTSINDTIHVAHSSAKMFNAKHVFFAGGFVNNPLAREVFTVEWLRRDGLLAAMVPGKKEHIKAHYMIHAQSLGAIGALINHKMQWHEKQKEQLTAQQSDSAKSASTKKDNMNIKNTVGL